MKNEETNPNERRDVESIFIPANAGMENVVAGIAGTDEGGGGGIYDGNDSGFGRAKWFAGAAGYVISGTGAPPVLLFVPVAHADRMTTNTAEPKLIQVFTTRTPLK